MTSLTWAVLRKELLDHMRDRRTALTAMLFPVLGPVLFAGMFNMLASWNRKDKPLDLAVVGAANAPNLVHFLERAGANVTDAPPDYEERVKDGALDVVLVIPKDYGADFAAGRQARVELVLDNSRNQARSSIRRAKRVLEGYGRQIAVLRLIARGVSPELATPVDIDEVDLATSEKLAANVLNMIPMFLLLAAFMGGMHLAIDSTAGERERGSLEPLLVNPVGRPAVVLGKWMATVLMTALSVLVCIAGFKVAIGRVPLEDLGVRAELGPGQMATILAIVVPLMLLAAGAQMLISTFARSFKEAQSYVQLLVLVPVIPAAFLSISPIKNQLWMMGVPFLSQDLLITSAMRGEGVDPIWLCASTAATLALAAACLLATIRLLGQERIVFGR